MFSKNYWAHFAPDGSTSPWDFIHQSGYNYIFAGENLAKGFTDANSVVAAWMNSPSHRENILSNKYKDVDRVNGKTYYYTIYTCDHAGNYSAGLHVVPLTTSVSDPPPERFNAFLHLSSG